MKDPSTIDCEEERCGYHEPHKHGMACDGYCPCGLGIQTSIWKHFEQQFKPDLTGPKGDPGE